MSRILTPSSKKSRTCPLDKFCPTPGMAFCIESPTSSNFTNFKQNDENKTAQPFVISVEGNIGSGKSTFIDNFINNPKVEVVPEPVEEWCNVDGEHNLLHNLYADPKRWSYFFNLYAFMTRMQMHKIAPANQPPVKMLERSIHSTMHVFCQNSRNREELTTIEFSVLESWYDWIQKVQNVSVDLYVYLRAPPEFSFDRLQSRSRNEESLIPFDLINQLHEVHENWLVHKTIGDLKAPVLILDATQNRQSMKDLYSAYIDDILNKY